MDRLDRGIPDVNCQERTRTQLLDALKITLREALDMSRHVQRRPVRAARRQLAAYARLIRPITNSTMTAPIAALMMSPMMPPPM